MVPTEPILELNPLVEAPRAASSQALKEAAERNTTSPAVVVLWIDWYAYHVGRFRALCEAPELRNRVVGIEMVGGTGVHRGLKFREPIPADLPVTTIFPDGDWLSLSKWQIAAGVWRSLSNLRPETVLVPGYYNVPALAAAVWGRLHGRRTVLLTESTESDHRRIGAAEFLKSILIRSLFSWAIAGGKPHRRYLEKLGFPSTRIASHYDVVDNRFFSAQADLERERHQPADYRLPDKYFLFVGRLAEEKNVRGLIESYLEYRKAGGDWSLVLVGDGPEQEALRTLAARSGFAQDIYFEGLRNSAELAPYYAFAGCFVLPSSREPWGLVVNEAMASGLPVIVSRQCGCAEDLVQEGRNGFVVAAEDKGGWTARLTDMAELTPELRQRWGERSLEIISYYSPEGWADQVALVAGLKSALASSRGATRA